MDSLKQPPLGTGNPAWQLRARHLKQGSPAAGQQTQNIGPPALSPFLSVL